MTGAQRKNPLSGAADAISRSRFSPYLFSFFLSAFGLCLVFLFARDSLSFLYETQAAGWYGLLRSLGRGNSLAVLAESNDLALLSFAFNPLNRLLALFPFSSSLTAVVLYNAIKCGLAAAAFAYFLKLRRSEDLTAVLFSVLFSLSSYSIVSQLTCVAFDAIVVLPLMLAGIERIVARRGVSLFSVSLALCAVTSPRTLFGFFVFSLLWLFVNRFSVSGQRAKTIFFDLLLILLSLPAAILLSAPVLFPSFDRLILSFIDLSFTQSYNLIEFFGKMLPATYDGLFGNRIPYLFIGMIPLLLLPIFFLAKKIPLREKIAHGILLFFLYFTFSVNVLSVFWDLFSDPDGYSYVVAVIFPALFLTMSARAFENADRRSERTVVSVALVLTALISILQRMDLSFETEEGAKVVWFSEINSVWVPLPFLALGCAGILLVIRWRESHPDDCRLPLVSIVSLFLMLVTVFDVAASGAAFAGEIAKKEGTDVSATEGNHAYVSTYYAAYAAGIASCGISDPLYRAEKFDAVTPNDASYLGYASLSALSPEILSAFGIEFNEDGTLDAVSSPLSLSLFGVRYVMTHEQIETKAKQKKRKKQTAETPATFDTPAAFPDSLASLFKPIYMDDAGTVYENAYVLPLLFRAAAIPDETSLSGINATPYSRVNSVLCTLTGDDTLSLYVPAQITSVATPYCTPVDSEHPGYLGYERNSSNGIASLRYTVTVSRDGPLFCSFPTEYPLTNAEIKVNSVTVGQAYTETETDQYDENGEKIKTVSTNAFFLGNFSEGETVTVALSFGSGADGTVFSLPDDTAFIYEIDFAATERALSILTAGSDGISAAGDALVAKPSDKTDLPFVVSTVPASLTRTSGADTPSFLGCFAAGNAEGANKVAFTPALGGITVYLLSLLGVLLLFVLLLLEAAADRGGKIPFFTRAAGGNAGEKPV